MLEVLKEGKVPILKFECSKCGAIFIASPDECYEEYVMGSCVYQAQCPCCSTWVTGNNTGVTADQKVEIEKLREDILKENKPDVMEIEPWMTNLRN